MYLRSMASAFPAQVFTQREVWEILRESPPAASLGRRGLKLLETVLCGQAGIDKRHFALQPPGVFTMEAQALNEAFEREAPSLAGTALRRALENADLPPAGLDALFVCTCTGYLCPGLSSHIAEAVGLPSEACLQDLGGLGCGAAIPAMQAASGYLSAHPGAHVAVVAVEICSAAFYLDDDPGVLISACLFGDGASASVWSGKRQSTGAAWRAGGFRSLHAPHHREKIRFVNRSGFLRNQLHRDVPALAAGAVGELFQLSATKPDAVIAHSGGRDVVEAIEQKLGIPLPETRAVLADHGNLSSPAVLVALERRLNSPRPGRSLWLTAFGAGFSAHCCQLHLEE